MRSSAEASACLPGTLLEVLQRHHTVKATSLFCRYVRDTQETDITFGELIAQAARYAHWLRANKVRPGELVLIVSPHDPMLLYAFVGTLMMGAVPAFLPPPTEKQDPEFFWNGIQQMTQPLSVAALIFGTDEAASARFAQSSSAGMRMLHPRDLPSVVDAVPVWHDAMPDDTAFLQFSSGTTGIRKGVMLSHAQVLEQIERLSSALHLNGEDRIVSWLPLYHDMGLIACFILPLVKGLPVSWMSPFEWVRYPARLFELLARDHGTITWMPNFAFRHLCATVDRSRQYDLSGVRAFINCSEACKADTFAEFAETFAHCGVTPERLQTCYAMAEAVFAVTQSAPGTPVIPRSFSLRTKGERTTATPDTSAQAKIFLNVGRLLPGFDIAIASASECGIQEGLVGEVMLKGPCISRGYYRNPQATQTAFRDGWYATGDIGFLHDGELYIAGRTKEVIIVNGRNYFAHDIEAVANEVDGVHRGRLVAIGVESDLTASEEVVLLVEHDEAARSEQRRLASALKEAISHRLGVVPRVRFVPVRSLIKTTSGKIDRQSNKERFLRQGASHGSAFERRDVAHA